MTKTLKHWYQVPHMWLTILLPAAAVIVSRSFVWLAVSQQQDLVRDDWYMDGKALKQDLSRDGLAGELDAHATFAIHAQQITVRLAGTHALDSRLNPPALDLKLSHPIHAQQDHDLTLRHQADGSYTGAWPALTGKYYLELSGPNWRLRGTQKFPTDSLSLSPFAWSTTPPQSSAQAH